MQGEQNIFKNTELLSSKNVFIKGNAAGLDFQAVEKKGYDQPKEKEKEEKKDEEEKESQEPPKLEEKVALIPDLVASSNDDTDGEDSTDASTDLTVSDEGGKPSKMRSKKKEGDRKKKKRRSLDLEKKKEEKLRIEKEKLEMERLEKKKAAEEKEREERRKTDPKEQVKINFHS